MAVSGSSYSIRPARKEDQEAAGALWLRLLEESAACDERLALAGDVRHRWHNDYRQWLQNRAHRILLAEAGSEVVGLITAERWSPPPVYAPSAEVYISELYVAPEARRRGIATALVAGIRAWAQEIGAERLRLGVVARNAEGIAFWQRQQAEPLYTLFTIPVTGAASQPAPETERRKLGF